jgi:hypothetical protein
MHRRLVNAGRLLGTDIVPETQTKDKRFKQGLARGLRGFPGVSVCHIGSLYVGSPTMAIIFRGSQSADGGGDPQIMFTSVSATTPRSLSNEALIRWGNPPHEEGNIR